MSERVWGKWVCRVLGRHAWGPWVTRVYRWEDYREPDARRWFRTKRVRVRECRRCGRKEREE